MKNVDIKSMFCPTLFRDADTIDASDHANYIIARILDYGDMNDVRTLRKIYSDKNIIEVIRTRRGLLPQTGKYWAVKFNFVSFLKSVSRVLI